MRPMLEEELAKLTALLREPCDSNDRMDARILVSRLLRRIRGRGVHFPQSNTPPPPGADVLLPGPR